MKLKTTPAAPEAAAKAKPLVLARSRIQLLPADDRLLLDGANASNERAGFLLTRRLTLQLFKQLRTQMEKDSPAGKQPSAWRDEALALEHAAILKSDEGKGKGKPWPAELKTRLVTNVGFKAAEGATRLVFLSGKQPVALCQFKGPALHRFAAIIALRIQQLRWDEGLDLSWLAKPPAAQKAIAKKPN